MNTVRDDLTKESFGAWLLKVDREAFDAEEVLDSDGLITGAVLHPNERTSLLAAGQDCFLFVSGRHPDGRSDSVIVGRGEITSPVGPVPSEAGVYGEGHMLVNVEIWPLTQPIHRGELNKDAALARCELLTDREPLNPAIFSPAEVDALERRFNLEVQRPVRPFLRLFASDGTHGHSIEAHGDGWLVQGHLGAGEDTSETFDDLMAAVASLSDAATAIDQELQSQVDQQGSGQDILPVAVFDGGGGIELSLFKVADRYLVVEVSEPGQVDPPVLGALDNLADGLMKVAAQLAGDSAGQDPETNSA